MVKSKINAGGKPLAMNSIGRTFSSPVYASQESFLKFYYNAKNPLKLFNRFKEL